MSESPLKIGDLAGMSEPACKLIEAIRAAGGAWFEPMRIRRNAKANADAALIKAQSDVQIRELEARAFERIKEREARRQANLEHIIADAVETLPDGVQRGSLNQDWFAQFTEHCQDISEEQMQRLWSKVLAGEFMKPGRYSYRTLHFLKLLSKQDAEDFAVLRSVLWQIMDDGALGYLRTAETDKYLADRGLRYVHFMNLESLGLVNIAQGLNIAVTANESEVKLETSMSFFGQGYNFEWTGRNERRLDVYLLTPLGMEVAQLCDVEQDNVYLGIYIESRQKLDGVKIARV